MSMECCCDLCGEKEAQSFFFATEPGSPEASGENFDICGKCLAWAFRCAVKMLDYKPSKKLANQLFEKQKTRLRMEQQK